jgi:predicted nucleic acid-binding protein
MNQASLAVDASVAAKWVLQEEFTDRAQALLGVTIRAGQPPIGPPHLLAETTNVIYRRRLRADPATRITDEQADQALADLLAIPVRLLAPADLYERAFDFARTYQLATIYDSLYVVCAQLLGVELWTADRRLLDALGAAAPWVRSIAEYPL